MAYDITELWSQKDTSQELNGWGATRYFSVTGTVAELLDERGVVNAGGIPAINSSFPTIRDLRVVNKSAGPGLTERIVTVRYQWMPNGGNPDAGNDDPISTTPQVEWGDGSWVEICENDVYGNPLANSAGDVFESLPEMKYFSRSLTIVRWESFYDIQKAKAFENRINSNDFVAGGLTFYKWSVKCLRILPESRYKAGQSPIPIAYQFEVRATKGNTLPSDIADRPFSFWRADVGLRSWSAADKKHPADLYTATDAKKMVTEPIRLNGLGAPLAPSEFLVAKGSGSTVTYAAPINNPAGRPAKVMAVKVGEAWFLGFHICQEADFVGLGL